MQCDMCGAESKLFYVEIEGSKLRVCRNCSKYGKVIRPVKEREEPVQAKPLVANPVEEILYLITSDYSEQIKKAREKRGLKQEEFAKEINEKVSMIQNLETGKFKPSIKLARKLEKSLNISIIEELTSDQLPNYKSDSKDESLTIGDMINIRKR